MFMLLTEAENQCLEILNLVFTFVSFYLPLRSPSFPASSRLYFQPPPFDLGFDFAFLF